MKIVFAYVPVVHKQVLTFLSNHKNCEIWLLDNETAKTENVYLERDARALPASAVKTELEAHGFENISVVSPRDLKKLSEKVTEFVIPEDEIVRFFLDKYAGSISVTAENIFIRWTQKLSTTEHEVPPDRTVTTEEFAKAVLAKLDDEAAKSPDWWRQIAAAIVKDGKIVIQTHNEHLPTAHSLEINGDPRSNLDAGQGPGIYTSIHAEANALAQCAKAGIATEGADMYVSTFPCPTCARSIVKAGIARVFYEKGYSLLDAEQILKDAGVEIILIQR